MHLFIRLLISFKSFRRVSTSCPEKQPPGNAAQRLLWQGSSVNILTWNNIYAASNKWKEQKNGDFYFKLVDVDKTWISHFAPASSGVNVRLFGMSLIIPPTTRPSSMLILA